MAAINFYQAMLLSSVLAPVFTGAYDAIPDLKVAYGLRRMKASYTGALLRIRRLDNSLQFDIGYLPNGDFDSAQLVRLADSFANAEVLAWYDQSGNGYNAVASGIQALFTVEGSKLGIRVAQTSNTASANNGFAIPLAGVTNSSGGARLTEVFKQIASPIGQLGLTQAGTSRITMSTDAFRTSSPWSDGNAYSSFMLTARSAAPAGTSFNGTLSVHSLKTQAAGTNMWKNSAFTSTLNGTVNTNPTMAVFPDATYGSAVVSEFAFFSQAGTDAELLAVDNIQRAYYGI